MINPEQVISPERMIKPERMIDLGGEMQKLQKLECTEISRDRNGSGP